MFEWFLRLLKRRKREKRKVRVKRKRAVVLRRKKKRGLIVSDLMTRNLIYASPSMNLNEVVEMLLKKNITGMPVVDGKTLVGEISEKDVLEVVRKDDLRKIGSVDRERLRRIKVSEVMKKPICIADDAPIKKAVDKMNKLRIRRLLVLDAKGKLVGILTKTDLMKKLSKERIKEKISTKVDEMLRIIEREKQVSIAELSKRMRIPEELIESWAKVLEDHDLIELNYPTVGSPILRIKTLKE